MCQKLWKSIDVRWIYSMLHQCRFLRQCIANAQRSTYQPLLQLMQRTWCSTDPLLPALSTMIHCMVVISCHRGQSTATTTQTHWKWITAVLSRAIRSTPGGLWIWEQLSPLSAFSLPTEEMAVVRYLLMHSSCYTVTVSLGTACDSASGGDRPNLGTWRSASWINRAIYLRTK